MRRNFFLEIYRDFGAHPNGHQHGGRKPKETSIIEFCQESVNLSLEGLKHNKIILFQIQELFR